MASLDGRSVFVDLENPENDLKIISIDREVDRWGGVGVGETLAQNSCIGLVRARASRNVFFHRLILEIEGEASGFDFSAASTTYQDFLSSPPRAALPASSSARRIFKDTRAVSLPSVPRVVSWLGGSRQAAQAPRKPPFCRLGP